MTEKGIKELLQNGECVTLECKWANPRFQNLFGKHTLHLPELNQQR